MNEDTLNLEIRKFLKKVGINSQRQIEQAVREAIAAGKLRGNEKLPVTMTLSLKTLDLEDTIKGTIALE